MWMHSTKKIYALSNDLTLMMIVYRMGCLYFHIPVTLITQNQTMGNSHQVRRCFKGRTVNEERYLLLFSSEGTVIALKRTLCYCSANFVKFHLLGITVFSSLRLT